VSVLRVGRGPSKGWAAGSGMDWPAPGPAVGKTGTGAESRELVEIAPPEQAARPTKAKAMALNTKLSNSVYPI